MNRPLYEMAVKERGKALPWPHDSLGEEEAFVLVNELYAFEDAMAYMKARREIAERRGLPSDARTPEVVVGAYCVAKGIPEARVLQAMEPG